MTTKLERAQIKRMKQAMFRARQYVHGEMSKRAARAGIEPNIYPDDMLDYFDGKDLRTWYDDAMREAAGPVYDALKELK